MCRLNEGFTMFIERKICGRLVSESYRQFMAFNGWTNSLIPAVSCALLWCDCECTVILAQCPRTCLSFSVSHSHTHSYRYHDTADQRTFETCSAFGNSH